MGLQTYGTSTSNGLLYDIFDYGTLMMLNIVAIAQLKVLELAKTKSLGLVLHCLASWSICFGVFLLEVFFKAARNHHTMRRLGSDLNAYIVSALILLFTAFLDLNLDRITSRI